jgi:hypothetical protein
MDKKYTQNKYCTANYAIYIHFYLINSRPGHKQFQIYSQETSVYTASCYKHILFRFGFKKLVPLHLVIIGKSGLICYRNCRCMRTIEPSLYHFTVNTVCDKSWFRKRIMRAKDKTSILLLIYSRKMGKVTMHLTSYENLH